MSGEITQPQGFVSLAGVEVFDRALNVDKVLLSVLLPLRTQHRPILQSVLQILVLLLDERLNLW